MNAIWYMQYNFCFRWLVAWCGVYLYVAMMLMLICCSKRIQALDRKCLWSFSTVYVDFYL